MRGSLTDVCQTPVYQCLVFKYITDKQESCREVKKKGICTRKKVTEDKQNIQVTLLRGASEPVCAFDQSHVIKHGLHLNMWRNQKDPQVKMTIVYIIIESEISSRKTGMWMKIIS